MADSKPGLTLVELLIGLLIGTIIALVSWSIYLTVFRLFHGQRVAINAASQNRIALDEITNTIPQAYQIALSCQEIQCKMGGSTNIVYKSSTALSVVLQLWPLDATGKPIDCTPACNNADYITYYIEGKNLIKETAHDNSQNPVSSRAETKKIIATNVKTLTFGYTPAVPSTTEVTITLTTEDKIGGSKAFNPYDITNYSKARLLNRAPSGF